MKRQGLGDAGTLIYQYGPSARGVAVAWLCDVFGCNPCRSGKPKKPSAAWPQKIVIRSMCKPVSQDHTAIDIIQYM